MFTGALILSWVRMFGGNDVELASVCGVVVLAYALALWRAEGERW